MDSKNIIIGILALTTVSFGVYGWTQQSKVSDRDEQIAKMTARMNAKRPQQSQQRSGSQGSQRGGDDASRQRGPGSGPDVRTVLQSPQARQLMASQQRGSIESRYAPLFKALNLPADQLAKFKDLLIEKQNAARDVMTVVRQEGVTDRAEIQQLIQQAQADVDNSIGALIGADKLAQYLNYEQTGPQRAVVSQVEQRLSYVEPLSTAQSQQLVALLAQYSPARDGGGDRAFVFNVPGGGGPMQFGGGGIPITGQVIEAAQAFLTPAQVDVLRQMQAEQADQQQLQQLFLEGGGGGGGGGKFGGKGGTGGKGSPGGGGKTKSRR